jgi:DNA helicase II / ATP-dependent DNA helicase PcrA
VAGLEEETFPHRGLSPDDDPDDLEEERRLAYVAFTRARQRLFLSYAECRRVYGELRMRVPSRFLAEMPQAELEQVGGRRQTPSRAPPAQPAFRGARGGSYGSHGGYASARGMERPAPDVPGDSHIDVSEGAAADGVALRQGMRVRHRKFGVGQVRSVTPGSPAQVTVSFPGWGEKTLVSSYLEPA